MTIMTRVLAKQRRRQSTHAARDRQVAAIYPHARTFALRTAHPVGPAEAARDALERLPKTLTLVTPDHADPSRDHLFVGAHPVLSANLHYDPVFRDLTFTASDGGGPIHGHMRLARSRTRAAGVLEYGGHAFAVEYQVKPQRYRMKLGRGAAYVAGTSLAPSIKWDTESGRWRDAPWGTSYELGFTFGVTGQEVIGDEEVYTFVAGFDDIASGKSWTPDAFDYVGLLDAEGILKFALQAGAKPPSSGGQQSQLFPYMLRVRLSEFAFDFEGGILTERPDLQGTVYGVIGDWDGAHVAGLYHLQTDSAGRHAVIAVHDRRLHLGHQAVDSSVLTGNTLSWDSLPPELAQASGLPESGHLEFSADGSRIVGSSFGATGPRVHPDAVAEVAHALAAPPELGAGLVHATALAASADPSHNLSALLRMSQFKQDAQGFFYDQFQQQSMEDFYAILQNYMNTDYRKSFFNPNPPPLDPGLYGISLTPGTRGTDPKTWYYDLSVAYTTATLSKWSDDPAAAMLNGRRADAWLQDQTAISDVMQAQGPLLYARRYRKEHTNLDWFLDDQRNNAAGYEAVIDAKAAEWIAQTRANTSADPQSLQKLIDQIDEMAKVAKDKKLYWAFAVYTYTTLPAYLNALQAVMISGDEIDGSEFTQRVQRTVALLNVLDTSGYFSKQYAYVLQLFQVANMLPQMLDYSNNLDDFSFAVKQIVDKFIEEYVNSPDPEMKAAAQALQQNASQVTVDRILQILRQSSAAMGGLYNWTNLAAEFESRAARIFSHLPVIVTRMIMLGAVGLMINFFITGQVRWSDLGPAEQTFVILNGAGIIAQLGLFILKRGVAFSEVFVTGNGLWSNFKLFFSPNLISQAQRRGAMGFKGWLLETGGIEEGLEGLSIRALFAEGAELAQVQAEMSRITNLQKIFGRNLSEFVATRVGAALAAVGIVMSAILLAESHEPLEVASNSLFLIASSLEFIATAGLWATQAFAIATIGGIAVGTIFAVVSIIGVIAMVAGVVLMCILMFRPQDSPVAKFAKESAGRYYMPYKTDIDYFQEYQSGSEPQRSGVMVAPDGNRNRALHIAADGTLSQRPFDASGHTAFYLRTDAFGLAQFGAPIVDSENRSTMMVLTVDDSGKLAAVAAKADTMTDDHMKWHAEPQGEGQYDQKNLRWAPFKLYNAYWSRVHGTKRYLSADGTTGWKLTDGDGTVLVVEMLTTKPQQLRMSDISWATYEHDQRQNGSLLVPGSAPRSWSLDPAPPKGLTFMAETGTVAMEIGVDIPPAARKTYRLTVTNAAGSIATDFNLEIVDPPSPDEPSSQAATAALRAAAEEASAVDAAAEDERARQAAPAADIEPTRG